MASTTTIASSITSPIATARPPIDMRFRLWPSSAIGTKVMPRVSGTASAATRPARRSRRNSAITATQSAMPTRIASRTDRIDSSTSAAWS